MFNWDSVFNRNKNRESSSTDDSKNIENNESRNIDNEETRKENQLKDEADLCYRGTQTFENDSNNDDCNMDAKGKYTTKDECHYDQKLNVYNEKDASASSNCDQFAQNFCSNDKLLHDCTQNEGFSQKSNCDTKEKCLNSREEKGKLICDSDSGLKDMECSSFCEFASEHSSSEEKNCCLYKLEKLKEQERDFCRRINERRCREIEEDMKKICKKYKENEAQRMQMGEENNCKKQDEESNCKIV